MNNLFDKAILDCNRREFFRLSVGAAAALTLAALPIDVSAQVPEIKAVKRSLDDCLAMEPVKMAAQSAVIISAWDFILKTVNQIQDITLRHAVVELLQNPAPRLMELYLSDAKKETVKQRLVAAGYIKATSGYEEFLPPCTNYTRSSVPFWAAPGSGYGSHHAYPGGLPIHVAVNLKASLGFFGAYKDIYGFPMNRDIVIAAQALHDIHKPWVFQWQDNGVARTEYSIAGTGSHHILSLAELIHRKMPAELIVATACAHNHPGSSDDERDVVNWLRAAAILAQEDVVSLGLLADSGKTLPLPRNPEGFITHLGDHDWVFAAPCTKWMIANLEKIAQREYGISDTELQTKKFYAFRNYVFSQATLEQLYFILAKRGETSLVETVKSIVA